MPISFQCGGCQATLNVAEEYAGKSAKCPQCGAGFVVPQGAAAAPQPSPAPQQTAPAPKPAQPAAQPGGAGFPGIDTGPGKTSTAPAPALGPAISTGASGPVSSPAPAPAPTSGPTPGIGPAAAPMGGPGPMGGAAPMGGQGPYQSPAPSGQPRAKRKGGQNSWINMGITMFPILAGITGALGTLAFCYYGFNFARLVSKIGFQFDMFVNLGMILVSIALSTIITALSLQVAAEFLKTYMSDR